MLVLSLKTQECRTKPKNQGDVNDIFIDIPKNSDAHTIRISVIDTRGQRVRLGFDAPDACRIVRGNITNPRNVY